MSEDEIARLAHTDHAELLRLAEDPGTYPPDLTFIAEALGPLEPKGEVRVALIALLSHEKTIVREGALLGLVHHVDRAWMALRHVSLSDSSPACRTLAQDILGDTASLDVERWEEAERGLAEELEREEI